MRITMTLATAMLVTAAACHAQETTTQSSGGFTVEASIEPSRTALYVHEEFSVTLEIRAQGTRLAHSIDLANLPSDTIARIGEPRELIPSARLAQGTPRQVRRFRITVVPLAAGSLVLNPTLRLTLLQQGAVGELDQWRRVPYVVEPAQVKIEVQPLPAYEGRAPFTGIVGRELDLSATVARMDATGPGLFRVAASITGEGNFENTLAPPITGARHFHVYAPTTPEITSDGVLVEQFLVARKSGILTVPPLSVVYFDTAAHSYTDLTAGPFPVEIGTGAASTTAKSEDTRIVILAGPTPLRIAPSITARPVSSLPAGRVVSILERHADWYRVRDTGPSGWVPAAATVGR